MLISFSASLFSNIFQSTPISANEEERKKSGYRPQSLVSPGG